MTSRRNKKASEKAIKICKGRCVVCGWSKKSIEGIPLVEGCHVKRFAKDEDADDFENIIALCPNHHTEFDKGNYYIDVKTHKLKHYSYFYEYEDKLLNIDYVKDEYLAYRQYEILEYWKKINKQKH